MDATRMRVADCSGKELQKMGLVAFISSSQQRE